MGDIHRVALTPGPSPRGRGAGGEGKHITHIASLPIIHYSLPQMSKPLCLVIDDEPDLRELSVTSLSPLDIECRTAENLEQAKAYLANEAFDVCLTDMRLPDGNGIELVEYINREYPQIPVAVITAHGNVETAVQALKAGAFDFIAKPVDLTQLRELVKTALQLPKPQKQTVSQLTMVPQPSPTTLSLEKIALRLIGESEIMKELRTKIEKLARSQAPVYIRGESGTGKEVVARMIHDLGARAAYPFMPVNCGAIPSELMESELFGYKKGSFTGAQADKLGLFQAAKGGTLFLDEVAELPLVMQVKLLRAIQEKHVRPVGSTKEEPVDVRILSATHRDLAELVKVNRFRQDLFYRLNVIELYVPPLRERPEDIPLLVEKILTELNKEMVAENDQFQRPRLHSEAIEALKNYSFPGNVRELENILERAMTLCENHLINVPDLQLGQRDLTSILFTEHGSANKLDPFLDKVEKGNILGALEKTKGNKTKAAELLGISFSALRYRLQRLGLERDRKLQE